MHYYAQSPSLDVPTTMPIRAAIVGARGYSGTQLCRLLLRHPHVQLVGCFSADANFRLANYIPEIAALTVATFPMTSFNEQLSSLDVLFLATPAEVSMELAPQAAAKGVKVIDLSGAFRLQAGNPDIQNQNYQTWYGFKHSNLNLLSKAHYGLQPFTGESVARLGASADTNSSSTAAPVLIANPGCYATAVLMALVPLLKARVIDPDSVVIDAKSGASGAGRKSSESLLFNEVDSECRPYKIAGHQHLPEITQACGALAETSFAPFFTTHLLPVRRGIVASIYAKPRSSTGDQHIMEQIRSAYGAAYAEYSLVRTSELTENSGDTLLSLRWVVGSARTHISYMVRDGKIYIFSLIDNLLKGAASQAIENMNVLFGFNCDKGLTEIEGVI